MVMAVTNWQPWAPTLSYLPFDLTCSVPAPTPINLHFRGVNWPTKLEVAVTPRSLESSGLCFFLLTVSRAKLSPEPLVLQVNLENAVLLLLVLVVEGTLLWKQKETLHPPICSTIPYCSRTQSYHCVCATLLPCADTANTGVTYGSITLLDFTLCLGNHCGKYVELKY